MKQETLRPGYQGARGYYLHAVSGRPMPLTDGMVGSSATGGITSTPSLSSVYAIDPVHLGKSQRIEELDAGLRATANRIAAVMDALNLAEMPLSSMKSKCWNFLVCWLLAFTMCLNAVPVQVRKGTAPAVRRSMGKHLSLQGVPNFGEVTPMLYRGGQPTQEGFDRLATMGIKILVDNGRSTRDGRKTKRLGMRFRLPSLVLSLSQGSCVRTLFEINQEKSRQKDLRVLPPWRRPDRDDDRSISHGRTRLDRGTSDEGDARFWLLARASPDMSGVGRI